MPLRKESSITKIYRNMQKTEHGINRIDEQISQEHGNPTVEEQIEECMNKLDASRATPTFDHVIEKLKQGGINCEYLIRLYKSNSKKAEELCDDCDPITVIAIWKKRNRERIQAQAA